MDERPLETPPTGFVQGADAEARDERSRFSQSSGGYGGASQTAQRGKEEARRIGSAIRSRAFRQADNRKAYLASELENFAGTVDDMGQQLADRGRESQERYASQAAQLMRRASRGLREYSSEELLSQAEDRLKARPGIFLAAFFAVGFLGARLLRD